MQVLCFKPVKLDILGMPENTRRVQKDFGLREANEVSRGLLLSSCCQSRGVVLWTVVVFAAHLAKGLLLVIACSTGRPAPGSSALNPALLPAWSEVRCGMNS